MKFAPLIVVLLTLLTVPTEAVLASTTGVVNDTPTGLTPGRTLAALSESTLRQDDVTGTSLDRVSFSNSVALDDHAQDLSTVAVLLAGVLGLIWARRHSSP